MSISSFRFAASWMLLLSAFLASGCAGRAPRAAFDAGPIVVARPTPETAALERRMHARLNRDRGGQGLGRLAFDAELSDIARAHSEDMRELDFFAHDSRRTGSLEDRLDRAGFLALTARENIGEGAGIDDTQDALLKSPGHRANILADDVTHVGIGIVRAGSGGAGRLLVTQVFATPVGSQDPERARAMIARRIAEARSKAGLRALSTHAELGRLAKEHVAGVPDTLDVSASRRIGDEVTRALQGSKLSGVAVATTLFVAPELYEPGGAVLDSGARAVGIATARARDARGRPAIKALVLVAH